jgi:hypothetical protein
MPGDRSTSAQAAIELAVAAINQDLGVALRLGGPTPVRLLNIGDIQHAVPVRYFDGHDSRTGTTDVLWGPFTAAAPQSSVAVGTLDHFQSLADSSAGLSPVLREVIRHLDSSRSLLAVGLPDAAVVSAQTAFEIVVYEMGRRLNSDLNMERYPSGGSLKRHLGMLGKDLGGRGGWDRSRRVGEEDRLYLFWIDCTELRNSHVHHGVPVSRSAAILAVERVVPVLQFFVDRARAKRKLYPSTWELLEELDQLL